MFLKCDMTLRRPMEEILKLLPGPHYETKRVSILFFLFDLFSALVPFFWLICFIVFTFSLFLSKKEKDMLHHFKIFIYGVTSSVFLMTKRSLNCSKLSHSFSLMLIAF